MDLTIELAAAQQRVLALEQAGVALQGQLQQQTKELTKVRARLREREARLAELAADERLGRGSFAPTARAGQAERTRVYFEDLVAELETEIGPLCRLPARLQMQFEELAERLGCYRAWYRRAGPARGKP